MSRNPYLTAELLNALNLGAVIPQSTLQRGIQYYTQGRVRVLECHGASAILEVRGSLATPYRITCEAVAGGGTHYVSFDCNCPVFHPEAPCKHIVAAIHALRDHLKRNPQMNWETALNTALRQTAEKKAKSGRSAARAVLFFSLQKRTQRWSLYPVSLPASKFPAEALEPELDRETIFKTLKLEALADRTTAVRNFDPTRFIAMTPRTLLAARMATMMQSYGYVYGYYSYQGASGLEQALPLLGEALVFVGNEQNPLKQPVTVHTDPLLAALRMKEDTEGLRLIPSLQKGEAFIPLDSKQVTVLSEDPLWLLLGKDIYCLEGAPVAFLALASRDPIVVPSGDRSMFFERYLIPLAEQMVVSGDGVALEELTTLPTKPRLYLSEDAQGGKTGALRAHLRFGYGDEEFPYSADLPSNSLYYDVKTESLRRIVRNPDAERRAWEGLSDFSLKRDVETGWFTLRARVDPLDFLIRQIPRLAAAGYEVFGEENLFSLRVNRNKPTMRLSVSSGIDWFDLEAVVQFGEVEASLKDIRRAIRHKEKFIKLADGSIGMIPEEWIDRYRFLFGLGEEQSGAKMRYARQHALLLEEALSLADARDADAEFQERKERLKEFAEITQRPLPDGVNATLYPYQKAGYDWLHFLHEYDFGGCLADDMGLGKAQPLDAKILTPTGWVTMGDIQVGMEVIGSNGQSTRVTGVYPQGEKEIFRVTFSDGAHTECCDEHLWAVNSPVRKRRGNPNLVLPLSQIRERLRDGAGNCRWYIPITDPVDFQEGDIPLPLPPYLVGVLIGDGGLANPSNVMLSSGDEEILCRVKSLLPEGYTLIHRSNYDYSIANVNRTSKPNPVTIALRKLGLMGKRSEAKFVPDGYKFASIETRLAVLQGLLDTDGWVTKDGAVGFSSASEQLARDVVFLVQSLGGVARLSVKQTTHLPAYQVIIAMPRGIVPFALSRKAEAFRPRPKYPPSRAIVSVESVGKKPAQCIAVEAADHLYVTDDFVVTHNTLQTIAYLYSLRRAEGKDFGLPPDLIVVPRSLVFNWEREVQKFAPGLRLLRWEGLDRVKDTNAFKDYDLVVTTYRIMLNEIETLRKFRFHYAILDEAQAIKNPMSQTARAARLLNADHRLTLTGTPVENAAYELWSQFEFLCPGLLGNLEQFREQFGTAIEKEQSVEAAKSLRSLVQPFLLRRTKDQVAPELPPRTEEIQIVEMEPAQRKAYNKLRDQYRGDILNLLEGAAPGGRAQMKILEALLRLRQICCHPRLADQTFKGDSGKFQAILETMETLQAEGHKALIFSQFVQMLTIVREELDARKIPYVYLDGSTRDREARVDTFQNNPNIPFFLISLKAGGFGLNLTAADYVLHVDPWWNPAVEQQATDRAHRIGQDKPVFVYKFIARDSVEEKVLELQERKRSLANQLVATEEGMLKALTRADIEALFT